LSICYTLLFFSASPGTGAPYAFVELQRVSISNIQTENRILTLTGVPEPEEHDADLAAAGGINHANASPADSIKSGSPVVIVLLLPDGRWQELSLPKLDLKIQSTAELEMWTAHLTAASQGKIMKPSSSKIASPRSSSNKAPKSIAVN
jgi:hypothetical protein